MALNAHTKSLYHPVYLFQMGSEELAMQSWRSFKFNIDIITNLASHSTRQYVVTLYRHTCLFAVLAEQSCLHLQDRQEGQRGGEDDGEVARPKINEP